MQHPATPIAVQVNPDSTPPLAEASCVRFRSFRLFPGARLLLKGSSPVTLGSRAFDLLHALLTARGEIVPKAALIARVWPTTYVEESNLRFQMAGLRRALGDDADLIKTVPGRGYLFADDVFGEEAPPAPPAWVSRLLDLGGRAADADAPGDPAPSADPAAALRALLQLLARELAEQRSIA
jgi:DNA-binding winged helix-turn-helix (wHTH) protein